MSLNVDYVLGLYIEFGSVVMSEVVEFDVPELRFSKFLRYSVSDSNPIVSDLFQVVP